MSRRLGIDRWNFAWRALVIVIDELHGPTKHSSFCVCVLFPDPLREQRGLAIWRETSGQRHAVADLDRRAGLRTCGSGNDGCYEDGQGGGARAVRPTMAAASATNHVPRPSALRQLGSAKS